MDEAVREASISGARVARALGAPVQIHGTPVSIARDDGVEFASRAIVNGATDNGFDWHYADPRKPQQKAFIELFSCNLRNEFLIQGIFDSPVDPRRKQALWLYDDYNLRPLSSLGNQTPAKARRTLEQCEGSASVALAQPDDKEY